MQLRAFLFVVSILFCSTLVAQNITGMWLGNFELIDKTKQKINVRLEIVEIEGEYMGVVYTRELDKNTVYGCDFVVAGQLRLHDNVLSLIRKSVVRTVNTYKGDCEALERLDLVIPITKDFKKIRVRWYWQNGTSEKFSITKKADAFPAMAKEEPDTYKREMYEAFEKNNILLLPQKRLEKIAAELDVDSSSILLEFNSAEPGTNDPIEVSVNGEVQRRNQEVSNKTLRLQMKPFADSITKIIVVSNSVVKPKLKIRVFIQQQQKVWEYTLEPGFTRNAVLLLKRRQD